MRKFPPNTTWTRRSSSLRPSNCWRGCSAPRWSAFLSTNDNRQSQRPSGARRFFEAREDQMANQPNGDVRAIDDKVAEAGQLPGRIRRETGDEEFTPAALAARSEAELRKISADLKSRIEEAEREKLHAHQFGARQPRLRQK